MTGLATLYQKLFKETVYYFDGKLKKFRFPADGDIELSECDENETPGSITFLIISRDFYSESVKEYPIDNESEVYKLISLDPTMQESMSFCHPAFEGKCSVNTWSLSTQLPNAFFYLPESALVTAQLERDNCLILNRTPEIFLIQHKYGLYSFIKNKLIDTHEKFAASIGAAANDHPIVIQPESLPQLLYKSFFKLKPKLVAKFLQKNAFTFSHAQKKSLLIVSSALLVIYLSVSSLYIYLRHESLADAIANQSMPLQNVIQLQQHYQQQLHKSSLFEAYTHIPQPSNLWRILAQLNKQADLVRVTYTNGTVEIVGKAEKATDVMSSLKQREFISELKFDEPVVKTKNEEQFFISFRVGMN